jgi:hypothetical protein
MNEQIVQKEEPIIESAPIVKKKGRPKGTKNKLKSNVAVPIVIPNRSIKLGPNTSEEDAIAPHSSLFAVRKKALRSDRSTIVNEIKTDHILIKEINLVKNMSIGDWEVGYIDTNHGKFGTGKEQTAKINQKLVQSFVIYLRDHVFEEDLKAFLEQE